ncbi:MAG: hypothetical protein NTW78_08085 [Campylobacterales bacterium]|nr:hypothetical protein [Campylobacterales bacterium]
MLEAEHGSLPSAGKHDALDAYRQLSATVSQLGENANLSKKIEEAPAMASLMQLETEDSLGLGGLLSDACRVAELIAIYGLPLEKLLISLLDAANRSVERFLRSGTLGYPAQYRLAFRKLGLSIGLHGVKIMRDLRDTHAEKFEQKVTINEALLRLERYTPPPLAGMIETFWMLPKHQQDLTWSEHVDINSVMLTISLAPDGFFKHFKC